MAEECKRDSPRILIPGDSSHGGFELVAELVSIGWSDDKIPSPTPLFSQDQDPVARAPSVGPILRCEFTTLRNTFDVGDGELAYGDSEPSHSQVVSSDSIVVVESMADIQPDQEEHSNEGKPSGIHRRRLTGLPEIEEDHGDDHTEDQRDPDGPLLTGCFEGQVDPENRRGDERNREDDHEPLEKSGGIGFSRFGRIDLVNVNGGQFFPPAADFTQALIPVD